MNPTDKIAIINASSALIQKRFGRHIITNKTWLSTNNSYATDTIKTLENHIKRNSINQKDLAEYIANSAPLHCMDGWSYLGRALESHSRGDCNVARHLGYYAELRAAMSLLATEGIGVFNNKHIVFDSIGSTTVIPGGGTHKFAWDALDIWSDQTRSSKMLGDLISPYRITLKDWFSAFGMGSPAAIGRGWLKDWGLDLKLLSSDRDARNEASYRPTRINSYSNLNVLKTSNYLRKFWEICEPSISAFEKLDRHLLRRSLEKVFEAMKGKKVETNLKTYGNNIDKMLDLLSITEPIKSQWKDFLLRRIDKSDSIIITEAEGKVKIGDPKHHIQVISRAMLLLRVATGASVNLLNDTSVNFRDLYFWWGPIGEDFGIWEPGTQIEDFKDLWDDVSYAIENILNWEEINGESDSRPSYTDWHRNQSQSLSILGECERIGLWGLGI